MWERKAITFIGSRNLHLKLNLICMLRGKMYVMQYKMFEFRMLGIHSNSVEPKVHILCHCYAAINIFIKIFNVLITFSKNRVYHNLKLDSSLKEAVNFSSQ